VGKTSEEITYALENNIFMFNVESQAELSNINRIANGLNKTAGVALRINPDVAPGTRTHAKTTTGKKENKFGMDFVIAEQIIKDIANYKNIDLNGIHVHLGSPIYLRLRKLLNSWKILWKLKTDRELNISILAVVTVSHIQGRRLKDHLILRQKLFP
ncbi:MAG: hypothetical protein ACYSR0_04405, partial [Planctomycetota bacterium]